METMVEKQHAHELIEQLAPSQISTAVRLLEAILLDPVARALANAPLDDEPVTEEDCLVFEAGQAWLRENGGKGIPMEEILAEFGLTMEDFPASAEDTH
jgi:hypothetical protein